MLRRLLFANFKLVYRISHWMRHRFTANGMMVLLIMPVAGVFGFDTRSTLSHQIFSITFAILIFAMAYGLFFRGRYSIERQLPDYGTAETPLYYTCTIKNNNNKPKKALLLIDSLKSHFPDLKTFINSPDPLEKKRNKVDRFIGYPKLVNLIQRLRGGTINPTNISYIAANSEARINVSLLPLRRGYVYFDKVKLAQADPMGLYQAQKTYPNKDKLLILPKRYKAPKLELHGKRTYQQGGVNNASSVGDSQEFISLRDYRPGDPLKSIHWRSYAKLNKPVVKEYQDEFFIRYGLVLDTWLDTLPEHLFEDAVSVAASFLSAQQEYDALLDLMFIGNQAYRFTSGRGLIGTENNLEILACIEAAKESNLDQLEQLIEHHARECSALICIFMNLDESRQQLIKTFSAFNIPIKVLVMTENEKAEETVSDNNIHFIQHGQIQQGLDKLK